MSDFFKVPTMAELKSKGEIPEVLFWVGCAGSFDDRAKKITRSFVKLLRSAGVSFAVLGTEESCSGDPAKRAGNDFLFQMQALSNIETMNSYEFKKIVTACPHCFNTIKNEYPSLGGKYVVMHHTQFLKILLDEGRLTIDGGQFRGKKITFHDPCYLGRANGIYEAPRDLIKKLDAELVEMKSCKSKSLCCGAGGAQMFKEPEKGNQDINIKRSDEAINTEAKIVAVSCPFCNTMMNDGMTSKQESVDVVDIAQMIEKAEDL